MALHCLAVPPPSLGSSWTLRYLHQLMGWCSWPSRVFRLLVWQVTRSGGLPHWLWNVLSITLYGWAWACLLIALFWPPDTQNIGAIFKARAWPMSSPPLPLLPGACALFPVSTSHPALPHCWLDSGFEFKKPTFSKHHCQMYLLLYIPTLCYHRSKV